MIATLGGVQLSAEQSAGWSLTYGARPFVRTFTGPAGVMAQIAAAGPVLALQLGPVTISGLRLVAAGLPGPTPEHRSVIVADSRWLLGFKLFVRDYNVPRRTGQRRLLGEGDIPVQVRPVQEDLDFARYSLDPSGSPWTARTALEDALTELVGAGGFRFASSVRGAAEVPLQGVRLRDPGTTALERLLGAIPGVDVYADYSGVLVVTSTRDGAEEVYADPATKMIGVHSGRGDARMPDRSWQTPAGYDVYFEVEQELRFDYPGPADGAGQSTVTDESAEETPRVLENVAPSPDYPAIVDGRETARGTWCPFGDVAASAYATEAHGLLASWDEGGWPMTLTGAAQGSMSQDLIARLYPPDLGRLYQQFQDFATPNPVYIARIQAVKQHWRRTFRIPRAWLDRFQSWRTNRLAVLDSEGTQTRAPSPVYTDWTEIPEIRGLVKRSTENTFRSLSVEGWAERLADGKVGPFSVAEVDQDLGILRVEPQNDPWGTLEHILPGILHPRVTFDPSKIAAGRLALIAQARAVSSSVGNCRLDAPDGETTVPWRLATILSVLRGAPNGLGRLYRVALEHDDIRVGVGASGGARGPRMAIYVDPTLVTARFAWSDELALPTTRTRSDDASDLAEALLLNPAEVAAVARGLALKHLARVSPRTEGSYETYPQAIEPTGSLAQVDHDVRPDGTAATRLGFPSSAGELDLASLLPAHVRSAVYRLVQP